LELDRALRRLFGTVDFERLERRLAGIVGGI